MYVTRRSDIRARLSVLRPAFRRWVDPIVPVKQSIRALNEYPHYARSWRRYSRIPGAEPLRFADSYPCLFDRTRTTQYDPHYFHQALWATDRILRRSPVEHVDVGSDVTFVGTLSATVPVAFVDIRPLPVDLPNLRSFAGDLLALPFEDGEIQSLSCLHVAEHVGLGRYGDRLAVDGTARACAELARVLGIGGDLFFSVPVGRPRVCFNAHRILHPLRVLDYFVGLELREFSLVDDSYRFVGDADPIAAGRLEYGCGLFWFRRP